MPDDQRATALGGAPHLSPDAQSLRATERRDTPRQSLYGHANTLARMVEHSRETSNGIKIALANLNRINDATIGFANDLVERCGLLEQDYTRLATRMAAKEAEIARGLDLAQRREAMIAELKGEIETLTAANVELTDKGKAAIAEPAATKPAPRRKRAAAAAQDKR